MRPTILATLTIALLAVPAAQAVEFPFGSAVASADYDFFPGAETQKVALCFLDGDGDGRATAGEPILLVTKLATNGVCSATVNSPSILLAAVPGRLAGSDINLADAWAGKPLVTLTGAHFVRYAEEGSDSSKLDGKDAVYIDLRNTGTPKVDVGDLRISPIAPMKPGTFVAAGDLDVGRGLSDIRGTARQIHDSNVLFKAGSGFYINADAGAIGGSVDGTCATTSCPVTGDYGVESGDIRLNPKAANPLTDSALVLPDKVELVQSSVAPGQPFQVRVTVKNSGKATGAGLIETSLDDVVLDGRGTPSVEPLGVAVLTITLVAPDTPGQHVVKVGTYADFLQVTGSAGSGATQTQEQLDQMQTRLASLEAQEETKVKTQGSPSIAPLAALGCLFAVAMLLRRRAE